MPHKIAAMILAAGRASRFGDCKQLAQLNGKAVIQHVIDAAESVAGEIYIVTGHWHDALSTATETGEIQGGTLLHNPQWERGMGRSIAWGVSQLAEHYDGILILLSDQAALQPTEIRQLVTGFTGQNLICSRYDGCLGAPALFPKSMFEALRTLDGDTGARALLKPGSVERIIMDLPSAALDIDTPAALSALQQQTSNQ